MKEILLPTKKKERDLCYMQIRNVITGNGQKITEMEKEYLYFLMVRVIDVV